MPECGNRYWKALGCLFDSWTNWKEYSAISQGKGSKLIAPFVASMSYYLGALGMPEFTESTRDNLERVSGI